MIQSFHEGADVKLPASYFKRSPLVLVTQPDITSLKHLSNQTIYGYVELLNSGSIREMLDLHHVDPTTIKITMVGNSLEFFKAKKRKENCSNINFYYRYALRTCSTWCAFSDL